jgi:hypothetical protein
LRVSRARSDCGAGRTRSKLLRGWRDSGGHGELAGSRDGS